MDFSALRDIPYFLTQWYDRVRENPDKTVLVDGGTGEEMTAGQLEDLSGRVYAWLRKNGVGTEDFVMLCMPRGIHMVVCMLGVWKAGAAFTAVEEDYAADRIAYIRRDVNCRVFLDRALYQTIAEGAYEEGFVTAGDHDAAFAVYTSGTTGFPKGVLHEYGNIRLNRASSSVRSGSRVNAESRYSLISPFNFVASVKIVLALLRHGCTLYVLPYETVKNPGKLRQYFLDNRISIAFLSPSILRILGSDLGPYLKYVITGSEPANNLFLPGIVLVNTYSMSEGAFTVAQFIIDRPYDICPVGKPNYDGIRLRILDENGQELPDGETGEIAFENPFMRGYINLPEETQKALRGGLYHTGDLGKKLPDGNLVLVGRANDMIKINGNRIEPAEIEAAVKQVLGVSWAAARGFEESGKSYLCAYYTEDITVDTAYMREELAKRLPYYMIPAYYMKIDSVPLKANGKMDRKALPQPDASDFRSEYVEPTNETEEKLCNAMAKVLKAEKVGIHDDFYELGGDSLGSIQVIVESGLPGLQASEIFRGRTPEKIAQIYQENHSGGDGEDPVMKNAEAMKKEHPLTAEQLYMVDYQLYTPMSTMYNLFSMMKLDKDLFDLEKMVEAMRTAIRHHAALFTTFHFNADGDIVQRYTPEVEREIRVEKLSEFEFAEVKDTLVQPFKIVDSPLYRCRVFETEKSGYMFFDVHHTLFDGTSLKVFMGNVAKIYMGTLPDPDFYYLMLQNREDAVGTAFYEESRKYFESRYDGLEWSCFPEIDHHSRDNEMGEIFADLGIEQAQMKAVERTYKISRNEFFIAVAILSIAVYNKKNNIKLSWIYNGREDMQNMTTVGLLFRDLPVGVHLTAKMTLRELFNDIHEQVQKGIEHSCYPYVDTRNQVGEGEAAYLLYQQDIRDMGGMDGIETVDIRQNQAASQTKLDMEILDGEEGLMLMLDYAASLYKDESMDQFKNIYVRTAQSLATHNSQNDVTMAELKKKLTDKENFFIKIVGRFRRKK